MVFIESATVISKALYACSLESFFPAGAAPGKSCAMSLLSNLIMRKTSLLSVIALCAISTSASALTMSFFGQDIGAGENTALTSFPNSTSAETSFLSNLSGVGTETFEGFGAGTSVPLGLSFPGAGTATLSGGGSVQSTPWGSTNGVGRYNVDGPGTSKYFETSTGFAIDFSSPIAAFGFYGIDIGDFNGQLVLHFINGGSISLTVPHTTNTTGGGVLFFGHIDSTNPFNRVEFLNSASGSDFFGFDRMTIGSVQQVQPVPDAGSTLCLLSLAFSGVAFARRKLA
jgi:hypothetical protein